MKSLIRAVAPAVVLLALTSCANAGNQADRPSHDTAPSTGSTSTAPTTDQPSPANATRVVVVRSGGLTGERTTRTFAADVPPPTGYTRADVRSTLATASDPALVHLELSRPDTFCCDRYQYDVTIGYADGSSKRFSTVDGAAWPPPFKALMRTV